MVMPDIYSYFLAVGLKVSHGLNHIVVDGAIMEVYISSITVVIREYH